MSDAICQRARRTYGKSTDNIDLAPITLPFSFYFFLSLQWRRVTNERTIPSSIHPVIPKKGTIVP
jgi:hypothetical protein